MAVLLLMWVAPRTAVAAEQSPVVRVCDAGELSKDIHAPADADAHRRFQLPLLSYPAGTKIKKGLWGLKLRLLVDTDGAVSCYTAFSGDGGVWSVLDETQQRAAVLSSIATWRYLPFLENRTPVVAVVEEYVREQELLENSPDWAGVPLDRFAIRLEEYGAGREPSYSVDIKGNGRVEYYGDSNVDVAGIRRYRVSRKEVQQLFDLVKRENLWTARPKYKIGLFHTPTTEITLSFGNERHTIVDQRGQLLGMPVAVDRVKEAVREVAGVERWIDLSDETLQLLLHEGFQPRSLAGAKLLTRAMCNNRTQVGSATALERLVQLGAADIELESDGVFYFYGPNSHLESALLCRRESLIGPMLAHDALMTDGVPDQAKLDRAFWVAIMARSLTQAQVIWNASPGMRPALQFPDGHKKGGSPTSVVYLLGESHNNDESSRVSIAQWLVSLGADIRSTDPSGDTLLHMAAKEDDVELVRWLLEQGLDPSALDASSRLALELAGEEALILLLLESGSIDAKHGLELRYRAEKNAWRRVLAWLDANKH